MSGDGAPNHACVAGDMTPPALASLARSAYCGALKAYGSASSGILSAAAGGAPAAGNPTPAFSLGAGGV